MSERTAVVTGGAGALGRTVVAILLSDGWQVHVPVRAGADAPRLRERHGNAPALFAAAADLTDPAATASFFEGVRTAAGRLDLLANLAGGFAAGSVEDTEPAVWARMLASNATAPFLAIRAALPLLRASGGGAIVNVASASLLGAPAAGMSAYAASKSALVSLTRTLAEELAPDRITVNAVAPTVIDTPANRAAMPRSDRTGWLAPEEIAQVIRFLASPEARPVTGNVLVLRKG